ncbi:jg8254 [Pararge aegeria aegeria]|uniref:Jg8254 protein n=1 Tax=Pararge aegeria aegeria TaxID=348720 RepID=A0A8S4RSI9_9NEOP|nr:jg8254 [Pararge aegeria aegeria]
MRGEVKLRNEKRGENKRIEEKNIRENSRGEKRREELQRCSRRYFVVQNGNGLNSLIIRYVLMVVHHINPLPVHFSARISSHNEKGLRPWSTTLAQCGLVNGQGIGWTQERALPKLLKISGAAIACIVERRPAAVTSWEPGRRAYIVFRASHHPPEVCLFINKRERYSTALGAVCITNLKEANLEALLTGMEYKIQ